LSGQPPGSQAISLPTLERLEVLLQREVGVLAQVPGQPPFERHPLHAGTTGDGHGIDPAGLAAALEIQRLMVGTETEKVLAASSLLLRSFE
jgi:hypothetical protein